MSGLLGQMLGSIMGGQQGGQPTAITSILQQLLASDGGGVAGLVSRFQAAGLGTQAQSWVAEGDNMPVSAAQISQVFSPEQLQGWASQAGTTPDKLQAVLAEALPQAVNHVTPGGQVAEANAMPDLSSLMARFFGSAER